MSRSFVQGHRTPGGQQAAGLHQQRQDLQVPVPVLTRGVEAQRPAPSLTEVALVQASVSPGL